MEDIIDIDRDNREVVLLTMSNDDLKAIGVDPNTVTDEQYREIMELMKQYVNEGDLGDSDVYYIGFQTVLARCYQLVVGGL